MSRFLILKVMFLISICTYSQSYEDFVSKSADYIEAENYIGAEQSLIAAMKLEPANQGNFLLLTNLGTIQRKLGKNSDALVSYSTALNKYPQNVFVLQNRASLLCEIDSLDAALADYNLILTIEEDNTEALYRRGLIFLTQKKLVEAELCFDKIIEKSPNNLSAQVGLAIILKQQEEWEKAEEKYTDLIYKHKTNADLYLARAECYLRMKKLARAGNDLSHAKEYGCSDPMWNVQKGLLYIEQFDKLSAKLEFEKAQELGVNKNIIDQYLLLCK